LLIQREKLKQTFFFNHFVVVLHFFSIILQILNRFAVFYRIIILKK